MSSVQFHLPDQYPPLSCMNDGIQVSTGATPGHGLLTVKNEPSPTPAVEFTYMNRKIKLTLKPEIAVKDKFRTERDKFCLWT